MKHFSTLSSFGDSLRGTIFKLCLLSLILTWGGNICLQAETLGNAVENSLAQGSQQQKERLLRGTVTDKSGEALPGVAVQV